METPPKLLQRKIADLKNKLQVTRDRRVAVIIELDLAIERILGRIDALQDLAELDWDIYARRQLANKQKGEAP